MSEYEPASRLGTVICTNDGPNVMHFSFVLEGDLQEVIVRRGEFVSVVTDFGTIIPDPFSYIPVQFCQVNNFIFVNISIKVFTPFQ